MTAVVRVSCAVPVVGHRRDVFDFLVLHCAMFRVIVGGSSLGLTVFNYRSRLHRFMLG